MSPLHAFILPSLALSGVSSNRPSRLTGVRWKLWHKAIGGPLTNVPEESWEIVKKEKHPDMLHLLQFPYNGEPPRRLVTAKPVTPNSLHFVRNHGGIPTIDAEKWTLKLDGLVANPQELTLKDLQDESKFERIERLVTIQCSGTRRIEQIGLYAGEGDEVSPLPCPQLSKSNPSPPDSFSPEFCVFLSRPFPVS